MSDSEFSNERQLDAICSEFEEQWSLDSRDIGSFLSRIDKQHRDQLLRMLNEVDVELRQKAGQSIGAGDYQHLGEEARSLVDELLNNGPPTRSLPDGDQTQDFNSEPTNSMETLAPDSGGSNTEIPKSIGRYQVESILGKGGFGLVFKGYDDQLQRHVAVKVPHARLVQRAEDAEAYLTEARIVANLQHPHIVPVYDVGQSDEHPCFVVSRYIEGTDLLDRIKQQPFSIGETVELVATVAEALHYAHKQGLVHRDVKPGNILLANDGQPFVVDFGLALKEQNVGQGAKYAGTPAYMSPEQAGGEGHRVDGRSDVYSLGTIMYELLVGRRPFSGQSQNQLFDQIKNQEVKPPRQIDDSIPKELERICLKSLAKRVSERYTTALDMAEDLRRFLEKERFPGSRTCHPDLTPTSEMQQLDDVNPLLKPFWRLLDGELHQILVVAATLAQLEHKNYVSTTNFVRALMVLKPGRISEFFSKLPEGALPESIPDEIPIQISALQSLQSFSPCINSAMNNLTPVVLPEEKLSSEDIYVDIARYATGKSTQRLRSHGVGKDDVEKIVAQLGWQLVQRKTTNGE